ncbi:MAG: hypothetical protein OXF88_08305 [Rhodobacteraceae bacterium]|nr:hypothetical protein [Paracoccaceae bacterium]
MKLALADRDSDGKGGSRNFDRDLCSAVSAGPVLPGNLPHLTRMGNAPSGPADSALLRENLQRVGGLLERTAATEEVLRETSANLERIVPAIDEIFQHSGDLSRERADTTPALSGALSRLDGIDGKMTNAAEAMTPLRQGVARLEERIGVRVRSLDSEPGEDGRDGGTERTGANGRCSMNPELIPGTGLPRGCDPLPGFSPFR